MAGDTVGFGNYNPYLMQQYGGANDDFMANLHFKAIEESGKIPGLTETAGSPAFRGAPETDTFERTGGGPGLLGTAAIAATGAAAGGAGGYYFLSNPVKDLKNKTLNSDFYKTIDRYDLAKKVEESVKQLKNSKGYNLAQLAKVESFDALPDEVKTFLKNNNLDGITPAKAKEIIEQTGAKLSDFELETVVKNVSEKFKGTEYYNRIIKASTDDQILSSINKTANADELKALITKHKDFFGIKGTEAEVAQKIEALAAKGKTQVADDAGQIIRKAEDFVLKRRDEIFDNLSKEGKLLDKADDATKALFKNFKWQQAKKYGKWGAIIAGGAALLYGLFGGNKKA